MSTTATATRTSTYTEARLRAVMPEIGADFFSLAAAGHILATTAQRWTDDLRYLMSLEVVRGFEIQLRPPIGSTMAVVYTVSADGSIRGNDIAGGIDWFGLADNTKVTLFVDIDWQHRNADEAGRYTSGWGSGQNVSGHRVLDRTYARDGYGVTRGRIGSW